MLIIVWLPFFTKNTGCIRNIFLRMEYQDGITPLFLEPSETPFTLNRIVNNPVKKPKYLTRILMFICRLFGAALHIYYSICALLKTDDSVACHVRKTKHQHHQNWHNSVQVKAVNIFKCDKKSSTCDTTLVKILMLSVKEDRWWRVNVYRCYLTHPLCGWHAVILFLFAVSLNWCQMETLPRHLQLLSPTVMAVANQRITSVVMCRASFAHYKVNSKIIWMLSLQKMICQEISYWQEKSSGTLYRFEKLRCILHFGGSRVKKVDHLILSWE